MCEAAIWLLADVGAQTRLFCRADEAGVLVPGSPTGEQGSRAAMIA
jgi:hypothetical protein